MTKSLSIADYRLARQRIGGTQAARPAEVVAWLGAVQAQDYLGALWALGLRTQGATEAGIEAALADRGFVRTWPLRGTLHFVAAADVHWILDLLAPRQIGRMARRLRQLGLDEVTVARSRELVIDALQGGRQLSRDALYRVLTSAGVSTAGQRGIHILGRLAHEGVICFGTREGKQHRFALLAEWIPRTRTLTRDEALAQLARRYVTSHGPATLQDFVWWSGLLTTDARAGLDMAGPHVVPQEIDGETYWLPASLSAPAETTQSAYLLPAFDEYLVGYRDRSAVLDPEVVRRVNAGGGMLSPTIVIDGQVVGTWKRSVKKRTVVITPDFFTPPDEAQTYAFDLAAKRYAAFLGLPRAAE